MSLNVKIALEAVGKSQEDLASLLRVEPAKLNRIINGRREADPALRRRIAEALNADERWLFAKIRRRIPPFVRSAGGADAEG